MVDFEAVVSVRECKPEEVWHFLKMIDNPKCDTDGGKYKLEQLVKDGRCFAMTCAGKVIGGYVLEAQGSELWVSAGGSNGALDMTKVTFDLIELQAKNFDTIGLQTRRKGLVKKLQKRGYEIEGYILRKKLGGKNGR